MAGVRRDHQLTLLQLGGSFATVPQIAGRESFRNWYQDNYRYAWVGARVVYNA